MFLSKRCFFHFPVLACIIVDNFLWCFQTFVLYFFLCVLVLKSHFKLCQKFHTLMKIAAQFLAAENHFPDLTSQMMSTGALRLSQKGFQCRSEFK